MALPSDHHPAAPESGGNLQHAEGGLAGGSTTERKVPRAILDAAAGAVAGGVARVIVSPLDVIKIRFQVQIEPTSSLLGRSSSVHVPSKYTSLSQAFSTILKEEGYRGLWRGTVPGCILVMPYTAIQFTVLHKFKSLVAGSSSDADHLDLNPLLSYIGGAVAGTAATVGSYPFDLLRTTLAAQGGAYQTMREAAVTIVRRRGVTGLYAGLMPTVLEIIPYAGVQFGTYDTFKRLVKSWNEARYGEGGPAAGLGAAQLTTGQHFTVGLAAGLVAKTATHPLDVIKKRFQIRGLDRHPSFGGKVEEEVYSSINSTIKHILRTEGVSGFYKGIWPSVVKAAPNAAIIFAVYELLTDWLKPYME